MKRAIATIFVLFNCSISSVQAGDEFKLIHKNDLKMNSAFRMAKSTLYEFLKLVDKGKNQDSVYGAYVKIEDAGETEYLWVTNVQRYNKDFYFGYVISTPRLVKNVKNGETIGFKAGDIFDWQHYEKNKNITHGAFTMCALMNPTSKEDNANIKKYGLQCAP